LHKLLCSKYQDFLETRPIPKDEDKQTFDVNPVAYKAAILFPDRSDTPQLIWLKIHPLSEFDSLSEEKEVPSYHYWEDVTTDLFNHMSSPRGMAHKQNGQDLEVYMSDTAFGERPPTKSLLTLNEGYGSSEYFSIAPAPWAGNLVVVNITKKDVKHPEFGDVDEKEIHNDVNISDLRYAFDYLTRGGYMFQSDKPNKYFIRKPGRWFKAVKVSCSGEIKFEGKKKYVEVMVSCYHPMFQRNDGQSSISKHLGFPLLVKRLPLHHELEELGNRLKKSFGVYENPELSCLMIDVEVTSEIWRLPPAIWDKGLDGTVLVARKDMKDLTVHQAEVLCHWCQKKVSRNMSIVERRDGEPRSDDEFSDQSDYEKEDLQAHIPSQRVRKKFLEDWLLSDKFANYFEKFKQKKISKGDATWADATVPPQGSVADVIFETEEERSETFARMMGMF
jgi:hypothetical protein